jgi:hypothetical protein
MRQRYFAVFGIFKERERERGREGGGRRRRTKARVLALVSVLLSLAEEEGGGGMIADWKDGQYRQPWQELLSYCQFQLLYISDSNNRPH